MKQAGGAGKQAAAVAAPPAQPEAQQPAQQKKQQQGEAKQLPAAVPEVTVPPEWQAARGGQQQAYEQWQRQEVRQQRGERSQEQRQERQQPPQRFHQVPPPQPPPQQQQQGQHQRHPAPQQQHAQQARQARAAPPEPMGEAAFAALPAVAGLPAVGEVLAYRLLEVGPDLTPAVSEVRCGRWAPGMRRVGVGAEGEVPCSLGCAVWLLLVRCCWLHRALVCVPLAQACTLPPRCCRCRVTAVDAGEQAVTLAPHPDPAVHPLTYQRALRAARRQAEAAGEEVEEGEPGPAASCLWRGSLSHVAHGTDAAARRFLHLTPAC